MRIIFCFLLIVTLVQGAEGNRLRLDKPSIPPPEQETLQLLGQICPNDVRPSQTLHGFLTCAACPDFVASSLPTDWTLTAIYHGHFTAPDADEAAVAVYGCEPHSENWGGAVLFRRSEGGFNLQWYEPGLIINDCLSAHASTGRDLLVCEYIDGHQSVLTQTLSSIDVSRGAGEREDLLLALTDNVNACGQDFGSSEDQRIYPLQKAGLLNVRIDARNRLVARVEYGLRQISGAESNKCLDVLQHAVRPSVEPATRVYTIAFKLDQVTWGIMPNSRSTKKLVENNPYR